MNNQRKTITLLAAGLAALAVGFAASGRPAAADTPHWARPVQVQPWYPVSDSHDGDRNRDSDQHRDYNRDWNHDRDHRRAEQARRDAEHARREAEQRHLDWLRDHRHNQDRDWHNHDSDRDHNHDWHHDDNR